MTWWRDSEVVVVPSGVDTDTLEHHTRPLPDLAPSLSTDVGLYAAKSKQYMSAAGLAILYKYGLMMRAIWSFMDLRQQY